MQWILRLRVYAIVFLAVLLILSAVTFSVLRAALPYATGYKIEIQQEVSKLIGLPVEIGSIDATIHWFAPRLKLIGVTIRDEDDETALLDFKEAFVQLDVIASVLHRDFIVDDIGMIGADISIEKLSETEWSVQGLSFTREGSSEMPAALLYMLQNADYLLHDSRVFYKDHTGDKLNVVLNDVNIDVENNFNNHYLRLSMSLPDDYGQDLSIVANLKGNLDSLDGEIYLEAQQLNIKHWNQSFKLLPEYDIDAILDAELWLTLDEGNIKNITSQASANDLNVKNTITLKNWATGFLSTNIRYTQDNGLKTVTVSDFYFGERSAPVWPETVNLIAIEDDDGYSLSADYLNLTDLQQIAAVVLDEEQFSEFKKIWAYNIQADVYNLSLTLLKDGIEKGAAESDATARKDRADKQLLDGLYLQASVNDFSIYDSENNIYLTGLDTSLLIEDGQVFLGLVSQDTQLRMPAVINKPLLANTLQGDITMTLDDAGWNLSSENVQLKNDHINTYSRLDVQVSTAGDIFLDVQTDFYDAYGKYANYYLPVSMMSETLVEWLTMAVTDGHVPAGQFILHGGLAQFPYDKRDGVFQAVFSANSVNMRFLEDWPLINNASGIIRFNNKSLQVKDLSAKTQRIKLFNGHAEIKDLLDAHLTVTTDAQAKNEVVQTYIWNSPLDDVLGNSMRLFQFSGDSKLNLKLDVPLEDDVVEVAIDGNLKFNKTGIYYPALGYEIKNLNGVINFTKDSIFADAMTAKIGNEKVMLSALTRDGRSGNEVVFHLDGKIPADYLLQHYDWIPDDWISGTPLWSLDLEVPYEPKDYLVHIKANSDLEGGVVKLSDKVNKLPTDKIQFSTEIDVLENNGLHVEAKADLIDVDVTTDGATADKATTDKATTASIKPGKAKTVNVFNLYAARNTGDMWNFDIDSAYIAGKGDFIEGVDNDTTVKLALEKLDLSALFYRKDENGAAADRSAQLSPDSFPQLDWRIKELYWDEWTVNDVVLKTDWNKHGMVISKFSLKGPAMTFNARGTWLKSWNNVQETVLEGAMTSSNFGDTLTGFGFERSIDHGKVKASFNAKWLAAPYVLSWTDMTGNAIFTMDKGEILEVEPGAGGRLLGLLNIFKLTNRLVFDFDDVTDKGFGFDRIKGEFEFDDGNGSLKSFNVSAPAADVNMFGSIGLLKHDYDLLMQVKPHTDTLTFAGGALLGGVVVGAGLALIQKVFDLGVLGHTVYSISGSWDNPEIKKIVEKTLDEEEDF
jgi:uncharacterized protein YhdP